VWNVEVVGGERKKGRKEAAKREVAKWGGLYTECEVVGRCTDGR
jgi:hypothetical protein